MVCSLAQQRLKGLKHAGEGKLSSNWDFESSHDFVCPPVVAPAEIYQLKKKWFFASLCCFFFSRSEGLGGKGGKQTHQR